MSVILGKEIHDLLVRAVNGEFPVYVIGPETWDEAYAGEVEFDVDGWLVTFFNDCDSVDYVDSAISPDGRTGEFNEWCDAVDREEESAAHPAVFFSGGPEDKKLEDLLKSARHRPPCTPKP